MWRLDPLRFFLAERLSPPVLNDVRTYGETGWSRRQSAKQIGPVAPTLLDLNVARHFHLVDARGIAVLSGMINCLRAIKPDLARGR
jgi:hypothetical protein